MVVATLLSPNPAPFDRSRFDAPPRRPVPVPPHIRDLNLGPETETQAGFIQRARVLAFYRTILRGLRGIPDPETRAETRKFVRDEFERHRGVTDIGHIRYLLSRGKTEWESMERHIGGM
ncbi:hypothetical protein VTJ49DRAFT_6097 [Mycothermus thermophilus]|uniref:LYR motif-containing protein 2 n=1 Tax=Humicola insolens TaxID=85995 RepID=A0ABR3V1Y4_HUMIN